VSAGDPARVTRPMKKKLDCYLRSYRRRWGLTQDELARLLGCKTGAVISRLERDGRQPNLDTAYALEVIFGTAPIELFPGLHARVTKNVIARMRDLYDELQGDSSKAIRLKLDFFEEVFTRTQSRRKTNGV
jgi:transcriptional regulator with XRE-family HTH domain